MIHRITAARSYTQDGEDGPSIIIRFDYVDLDGHVRDVELDVTSQADTLLAQLTHSVNLVTILTPPKSARWPRQT